MTGGSVAYHPGMKKDKIIAGLLTAAIVGAIGALGYIENKAPPLPTPARSLPAEAPDMAPKPEPREETYYTAPNQQRHSNGLYRCIVAGRTTYQDQPCQDGQQATVAGTMSVVPRYPVQQAKRALSPEPSGPRVAMIDNPKPAEHHDCTYYRRVLYDIQSTAQRRAEASKRMQDIGCKR